MGIIEPILWVLFTLLCVVASAVILLQDGKGGGLGEAFGGAGAQSFGVDNKGVAKFTGYVAVGVLVLSIIITRIHSGASVLEGSFSQEPGELAPVGDVESTDGAVDGAADAGAGAGDVDAGTDGGEATPAGDGEDEG